MTDASPTRNVFWGSDPSDWDRVDIAGITADTTLATEFRALLDQAFTISDLQLKEIENYITYIYDDGGLTPAPQTNPRPKKATSGDAHYLGDIYHSRPVIVTPPYDITLYDDFGFVPDGEAGAHNYRVFAQTHEQRRRVALAGGNDGMLHAFDAGFFNRDTTNFPARHDAGTGRELFAWVPRAVMPNLYNMVYAAEHQYLVTDTPPWAMCGSTRIRTPRRRSRTASGEPWRCRPCAEVDAASWLSTSPSRIRCPARRRAERRPGVPEFQRPPPPQVASTNIPS
jgi:hypothetical protein